MLVGEVIGEVRREPSDVAVDSERSSDVEEYAVEVSDAAALLAFKFAAESGGGSETAAAAASASAAIALLLRAPPARGLLAGGLLL